VELREVAPAGEPFLGERLLQVFRVADRNGDGLLSLEETSLLPGIRDHFGRFDRNADGFVSLEELMLFRRSLAPKRYRQAE
jgi:Ca2+-binding EF-hand superfamily protein